MARNYGAPFVSKFFLKDYGSGTNQMGGFVGGAPFLQMAGLGGFFYFFDFIFVFQELTRVELLHLVYLYEYSNYLTEGLSSRFIVQLVIIVVTWIVKCMLSTLAMA